MRQGIDGILAGYPDLQEAWGSLWLSYVKECEMGVFVPLTVLGAGYDFAQSDRDVWCVREILGLRDDYQFYMIKYGDEEVCEVWGFNGYSASAECCLIFRNYEDGYELIDTEGESDE